MPITNCPLETTCVTLRVQERVELLAVLLQVNSDDSSYSANPRLINVLSITHLLEEHIAAGIVRKMSSQFSRDQLIKQLVDTTYGNFVSADMSALVRAIDELSSCWEEELGAIAPIITKSHRAMRELVANLYDGMDPVHDVERMTGDRDKLRVVVTPTLFLPPPQTGRHGVIVSSKLHGTVAHLFFGFPLDDNPAAYGITRYWIMGGGWHYAVERFIHRHWPSMAETLRGMPEMEKLITEALAPHRKSVVWPTVIAEHINIALKCLLSRRESQSELVHRSFAQARGLVLFPWFDNWINNLELHPAGFLHAFKRLPEDINNDKNALLHLTKKALTGPPTINMALASAQDNIIIVFPDNWDSRVCEVITKRWEIVTSMAMKESQWTSSCDTNRLPAIVFGIPGHDKAVTRIMKQHNLSLEVTDKGGDVLLALIPSKSKAKPWNLLIAVADSDVASRFAAEQALDLFHVTAHFSDFRFIEGGN